MKQLKEENQLEEESTAQSILVLVQPKFSAVLAPKIFYCLLDKLTGLKQMPTTW